MFSFKLQKILELRIDNEKQSSIFYTSLLLKKEMLDNIVLKEKNGYFHDRELWTEAVKIGDMSKQAIFDQAIENRKKKIMALFENINSLKDEIAIAEMDLKESRKKLKILEKIREKSKKNYDSSIIKKDKKEMDEYGLKKYRQEHINIRAK